MASILGWGKKFSDSAMGSLLFMAQLCCWLMAVQWLCFKVQNVEGCASLLESRDDLAPWVVAVKSPTLHVCCVHMHVSVLQAKL